MGEEAERVVHKCFDAGKLAARYECGHNHEVNGELVIVRKDADMKPITTTRAGRNRLRLGGPGPFGPGGTIAFGTVFSYKSRGIASPSPKEMGHPTIDAWNADRCLDRFGHISLESGGG